MRRLLRRERTRVDNRMYAVELTARGERVLETARRARTSVEQKLLDSMPSGDREKFMRALQAIVDEIGPINSATAPEGDRATRLKHLRAPKNGKR